MVENEKAKPHLVLNFDINKTIILRDKSKNLDIESGVKSCIVDYAWGIYNESLKTWTLTENYLSHKKPKQNLKNFYYYIKKNNPLKTDKDIPEREELYKKNQEIKNIRDNLFLTFLDKGHHGEKLYNTYLEYLKKISVPEKILKEINKDKSKYSSFYKELFLNGYIFIFNSLFRLMIELQNKERIFSIIFRTFGFDFDDVIKEYNSFCEGGHPIFSGDNGQYPKKYFDGTNGSKDYRIKVNNIGIIYRFDEHINNICLVLGTLKRIKVNNYDELLYYYKEDIEQKKINIIKGGKNIFEYININSTKGNINSFCINDHYEIWSKYDKNSICGKPMFIDPDNKNIEVFFFDDNIDDSNKSIVDCRNILTGDIIESKEIKEKYVIKADSLKAAEDEYYFLDIIENVEKSKF